MMMEALERGGMTACYQTGVDDAATFNSDDQYNVNPGGLRELAAKEYRNPEFPDNYQGKLVKCLWGGMKNLRESDNIKNIIMMRRPVKEIASSCEAVWGHKHPKAIAELDAELDALQDALSVRPDVRLIIVQYHDVINTPYSSFSRLKLLGWPIDPEKAAEIVNPQLYRHRQCANLNA